MGSSIALALYLAMAARGGTAADGGPREPRPEGRLIWLHAGEGASFKSLGHLAARLVKIADRPRILLTAQGAGRPDLDGLPEGTIADILPADRLPLLRPFLTHWRPDLALFAGNCLLPALITETHALGIPMILADVRMNHRAGARWRWRRGMAASLLARFDQILTQDPETAARITALGGRRLAVSVAGRIEQTTDPLACNEAERNTLAQLLQARPVWLAAACPKAEEDAVIAAHTHAMRLAHRMLLILVPSDPAHGQALNDRMSGEGWIVGQRSHDEEPDPDVQVFIADVPGEMGLWYRLAPVTYMGGTLSPDGAGRNPFEPAALGSAIVHGPHTGPYPEAYARLAAENAVRRVETAVDLAAAVGELIAPDKAAMLAHNAWATSSGGAEVAERVVALITRLLATPKTPKAVA